MTTTREFKTILCPMDFSEHSYQAVKYALRLAKVDGGRIILAHVVHVPTEHVRDEDGNPRSFDQLTERAKQQLVEAHQTLLENYKNCETIVDIGDPYDALMRIVSAENVDLIVTSTHGRSGIKHLVMGSVADKIIRHAPCPVFVVRQGVD